MTHHVSRLSSALTFAFVLSGPCSAAEWPAPIRAIEAQGVTIIGPFAAPGGLTGFAATAQGRPIALYLLPDKQHVIVGPMFDAKGANVSEEPLTRLAAKPLTESGWKALAASHWIADGKPGAARIVYVFTDPNCPYCHKFWNDARPWIEAGSVQLRHVLVGILMESSPGKAAALLAAKDPSAALNEHEVGFATGGVAPLAAIPSSIRTQLDANEKLMQSLNSRATPTVFYLDARGVMARVEGAPSPEALLTILGPRPGGR